MMLKHDENNCAKFFSYKLQNRRQNQFEDVCEEPLFCNIQEELWNVETIKKLVDLHDNYEPNPMIPEMVTNVEIKEESDFLDACLDTRVMKLLFNFMMKHKLIKSNLYWKEILHELWFERWSEGSCAFEHIFLGELKRNKVSGVHNWVFFLLQEVCGKVNYFGFDKALDFGNNLHGDERGGIITSSFSWEENNSRYLKPYSGLFIGVSPEMEVAIYTLAFFLNPGGALKISLGGSKVEIQTHTVLAQDKTYISSAFPKISHQKLQLNEITTTNVIGTLLWFNKKKGFGFIKRMDTKEDVFVHRTEIGNYKIMAKSILQFDIKIGLKGNLACHVQQVRIKKDKKESETESEDF